MFNCPSAICIESERAARKPCIRYMVRAAAAGSRESACGHTHAYVHARTRCPNNSPRIHGGQMDGGHRGVVYIWANGRRCRPVREGFAPRWTSFWCGALCVSCARSVWSRAKYRWIYTAVSSAKGSGRNVFDVDVDCWFCNWEFSSFDREFS